MVSKSKKDIIIRVTEQEKKLLEVIRNFKKGTEYKENILYLNDGFIPNGYMYEYEIEKFYSAISSDKTLLACYDVAVKEIGKKKLFFDLSSYTPFIINIAFQNELKKDNIDYQILKKNELKKGYIKKKLECLYVSDIDGAIEDFKKYLEKNYLEKAVKYIEEKEKIEDNPYISVNIKKYEIKYYIELIKTAIDLQGDFKFSGEEDGYIINTNIKFYEKFLELIRNQKDGFKLNIHPAFMDLIVCMFETEKDRAEQDIEGYSLFCIEDQLCEYYKPNLSPKEREKRGRAILNILENISQIRKDNEKLIRHFEYEMSKNREEKYRENLLNKSIVMLKGEKLNEKRRNQIYKFKR